LSYDPSSYKTIRKHLTKDSLNVIVHDRFCVDISLESPEDRLDAMEKEAVNTSLYQIFINPK